MASRVIPSNRLVTTEPDSRRQVPTTPPDAWFSPIYLSEAAGLLETGGPFLTSIGFAPRGADTHGRRSVARGDRRVPTASAPRPTRPVERSQTEMKPRIAR